MVDAVSSADLQGSRMPIIVPNVRAWRKTVMAVPKLSILVPVEQTCFMSGDVSASRRVSPRPYFSSEILAYYVVHATQVPTKKMDTDELQTHQWQTAKQESSEASVVSWVVDGSSYHGWTIIWAFQISKMSECLHVHGRLEDKENVSVIVGVEFFAIRTKVFSA